MSTQPTALLSVSDKTNIIDLAKTLVDEHNFRLVSSGGTAKAIADAGLPVTKVADVTKFPEMLDGRVKTLHPNIHGGLLADLDKDTHLAALAEHNISPISLLVVNLYPFKETVAKGADWATCIENIDIGGPAMVRAAAKNHAHIAVVTDPADYPAILSELAERRGNIGIPLKQVLAAKAFQHTASYDSAVAQKFSSQLQDDLPATYLLAGERLQELRYGENPHQAGAVYRTDNTPGPLNAKQLNGKPLSYNNLNDADAAYSIMLDLHLAQLTTPNAVIVKHASPCGVAIGDTQLQAWQRALDADSVSAFGGIVAFNQEIDKATAEQLKSIFLEVIIAPSFSQAALDILTTKKNVRLLATGPLLTSATDGWKVKSLHGGFLVQAADTVTTSPKEYQQASERSPTEAELIDLQLAFTLVKHVKSNAVVLVKNGVSVGIGAGQTSRVTAAKIACRQAADRAKGAVVASDAFFPFADGAEVCLAAGATAFVQPGGSKRDGEVIEAINKAGAAMVFTGKRHFLH